MEKGNVFSKFQKRTKAYKRRYAFFVVLIALLLVPLQIIDTVASEKIRQEVLATGKFSGSFSGDSSDKNTDKQKDADSSIQIKKDNSIYNTLAGTTSSNGELTDGQKVAASYNDAFSMVEGYGDDIWRVTLGSDSVSGSSNILIQMLANTNLAFFLSIIKLFAYVLRAIIVFPFLMLDRIICAFAGGGLYSIILGRVGSGSASGVNFFGFELVKNNPYGIAGSVLYGLIRGISLIFLTLKFAAILVQSSWSMNTGSVRQRLKESLQHTIFMFFVLMIMPRALDAGLYLRDVVLYNELQITESIVAETNSESNFISKVAPADRAIVSTGEGVANIAGSVIEGVGTTYNPYAKRAIDFKDGTFLDSMVYVGTVILEICFICVYITLAVNMTALFICFPVVALQGREQVRDWVRMMLSCVLTPCVDMAILMIPLCVSIVQWDSQSAMIAVGLIQIVVCGGYLSMRRQIRVWLGLGSANSMESHGFGGVMAAMTAARALGALLSNVSNGTASARGDSNAADYASDMASNEAMEASQLDHALDSKGLNDAMEGQDGGTIDGISSDDGTSLGELETGIEDTDGGADGVNSVAALNASLSDGEDGLEGGEGSDTDMEGSDSIDGLSATKTSSTDAEGSATEPTKAPTMESVGLRASDIMTKEKQNQADLAREEKQRDLNVKRLEAVAAGKGKNADPGLREQIANEKVAIAKLRMQQQDSKTRYDNAAEICGKARASLGLRGMGPITSSELNARRLLQSRANLSNFETPLMRNALSNGQLAAMYRKRASVTQGCSLGSAAFSAGLAGVVGGATMFMPTSVKTAAIGASLRVGSMAGGLATNALLSSGASAYTGGVSAMPSNMPPITNPVEIRPTTGDVSIPTLENNASIGRNKHIPTGYMNEYQGGAAPIMSEGMSAPVVEAQPFDAKRTHYACEDFMQDFPRVEVPGQTELLLGAANTVSVAATDGRYAGEVPDYIRNLNESRGLAESVCHYAMAEKACTQGFGELNAASYDTREMESFLYNYMKNTPAYSQPDVDPVKLHEKVLDTYRGMQSAVQSGEILKTKEGLDMHVSTVIRTLRELFER